MSAHPEVAAYALGLMEPDEARRFEAHLAGCDACAAELEELLPVAHLLADVDPEDVLGEAEGGIRAESPPSGPILVGFEEAAPRLAAVPDPDSPAGPRPAGRRPGRRGDGAAPRRRFPLAVAAGFAGLAIGAGAVAATTALDPGGDAPPAAGPGPVATTAPPDAVLSGTGSSGVHADVSLTDKAWGTLVAFKISDIDGPRECRLVAERRDGSSEVLSSWLIPERGYGTDTKPAALSLTAATSLQRNDIRALRVQEVGGPDDVNAGPVLVSVEA